MYDNSHGMVKLSAIILASVISFGSSGRLIRIWLDSVERRARTSTVQTTQEQLSFRFQSVLPPINTACAYPELAFIIIWQKHRNSGTLAIDEINDWYAVTYDNGYVSCRISSRVAVALENLTIHSLHYCSPSFSSQYHSATAISITRH
jgi:hypothetical protein